MMKKRTTVYLDENLVKILKIRSIKAEQSTSEYISKILYADLLTEQEDLKEIEKILDEPTIPFEELLEKLDIKNDV